ncbi:hypothetical protein [Asticcacaulis sp. AC402]|uniref:hypothetical protein n=1 Tax=Asticcacaulis sp. AC402 TaxID=1282361 RepID=UPI0003C3F372|nr:hypothetical protein [Asticcacaulis sp. AC402]ESQ77141.1 hypothetical protein ABAC402_01715 [Asticcacaulis sp. AC402]
MLHGPEYRSGHSPDIDDYRALRKHGRHRGDQAVRVRKKGGLSRLIFLAVTAIAFMVWAQNGTLQSLLNIVMGTGCAVAHHLGRPRTGDTNFWADGRFNENGGCEGLS